MIHKTKTQRNTVRSAETMLTKQPFHSKKAYSKTFCKP